MGSKQRSQIEMTPAEISAFVARQRTANLATLGPDGQPHLVAMWYAVIDGVLWFETKAKAQKALNLRRDPRATVMVEDGLTYDTLRGVSFEGRGVILDDSKALWAVGVNVWERYHGPYTDELAPFVEAMLHKRVAVRFEATRTRSWDHRKLGLDPLPLGGNAVGPEAR